MITYEKENENKTDENGNPLPVKYQKDEVTETKNLDDFIEHLKTTKNNESTAYFISVYTNTEFYVAKNFVADNCAKTIEIIKEFVKTYNVY